MLQGLLQLTCAEGEGAGVGPEFEPVLVYKYTIGLVARSSIATPTTSQRYFSLKVTVTVPGFLALSELKK